MDAHQRARWRKGLCAQVDLAPIGTHAETYAEMDWLYKEVPLLTVTTAI
jgi:hypothetical protein